MISKLISGVFPDLSTKESLQEGLFSGRRLTAFFVSLFQLCLLFYVISIYSIEKSTGLKEIVPFILSGFVINSFVPIRFRPAVLFATCIAVIYFAFGFFTGNILIVTSVLLILCCHLPIRFSLRLLLVLAIAIGLLILRAELFFAPRAALVTPFIASMFMFRLIIYMYEVKHKQVTTLSIQTFSYFFLFPNICFLFFPIIDYKTYLRTYYSAPDNEIWQKGIRWMLRGIVHVLCYRVIYYYFVTGPTEVTDLGTFLWFAISNFVLVLRISGMFHLIVGMLCMFGLNLPQTFDNYFLASGITDLWRRINIYWREFILKIFYYPLTFRLKKKIPNYVLPVTLLLIFVFSWLLHNYQLFWIRGEFKVSATDLAFWMIMGILITIEGMQQEKNTGRENKVRPPFAMYLIKMLKICGTFLFMSLLWSLWESKDFSYWFFLVSKAGTTSAGSVFCIIAVIVSVIVIGIMVQFALKNEAVRKLVNTPPHRTLATTLLSIAALLSLNSNPFKNNVSPKAAAFITSLGEEKLNEKDKAKSEQGYYGKLIEGEENKPSGLWEIRLKRQKNHKAIGEAYVRTDDLLTKVIIPNARIKGTNYTFESNSFGLRDREYPMKKDPKSCRVALLGGSYEMGAGVSNNEVFEAIVEKRLNENNTDSCCSEYEILNFANSGFYLIQHVELCNTKVFDFEPDALFYCAHNREKKRLLFTFTDLIQQGKDLKYPYLEYIKTISGAKQSMSEEEIQSRLQPYAYDIIRWSYVQMVEACRKHNTVPVWVFVPITDENTDTTDYKVIRKYAEQLHFVILDMTGAYGKSNVKDIQLSEDDAHPNPAGQKMLAEKFYAEFLKNRSSFFKAKR